MAEKLCTRCQAPGGQFVIRGKDDSGAWLPWEEDTDRHAPAPFGKCRAMVVLSPSVSARCARRSTSGR